MPSIKQAELERLRASEEVCWKLLILMGLGELKEVPMGLRPLLADPMQEWANIAADQGLMGEHPEYTWERAAASFLESLKGFLKDENTLPDGWEGKIQELLDTVPKP